MESKKTHHITINLTAEQYQEAENQANNERRKLAEFVGLVLVDELKRRSNK